MQSFGERLRNERETRNTTIEDIAAVTGIHAGYLEALEKNEFQALPGRAFGKFYLRVYAEVLDFDPEPLIVHYDRERHRDPPEPAERRAAGALRKVEAALAKWREEKLAARHGGREIVDDTSEEPAEPERETAVPTVEASADLALEPLPGNDVSHVRDVHPDPVFKPFLTNDLPVTPARRSNNLAATVVVMVGVGVAAILAVYLITTRSVPGDASAAVVQPAIDLNDGPAPLEPFSIVPEPTAPRSAPKVAALVPAALTVSEFGVGRRVVDLRLEEPGAEFTEGEVVAFATRVQGGRPGAVVRHVWLHSGRVVQSIRLPIRAADWRTHSTKTLWGAGSWVVEARDERGRVLARAEFTCARAGS